MKGICALAACLAAAVACPGLAAAGDDPSGKVWELLKERKYFEAEQAIAALPAGSEPARADAEAVKLLREFWAAVERGVAARKGKFLAIAGAGGNIVSVKQGEVILQAGKVEFKRRLDQLDARHAVLHADLTRAARSNLMKGVFLLAEGEDLAEAGKALDAAGDAPFAAYYRQRLARLRLGSREDEARDAWQQLEAAARAELTQDAARQLLASLEAFAEKYANTQACQAARSQLEALRVRAQHAAGGWVELFDGNTLGGWKIVEGGSYAGHGKVGVVDDRLVLEAGSPQTAVVWTREFPTSNYELRLEATLVSGSDFAGIVFPVGPSLCLLALGHWRNSIVGLSCVDGRDANSNPTTARRRCESGRPYQVRLRVTAEKIEAWLDEDKVVDIAAKGHKFSLSGNRAAMKSLALESWSAAVAFRQMRFQRLGEAGEKLKTAVVPVPASAEWFDTGLDLAKGERYLVAAQGKWGPRPDWEAGPEGSNDFGGDTSLVKGARGVSLVGRIGAQLGFEIGKGRSLAPEESGRLFLAMNDLRGTYGDNWGTLRVTVSGALVADAAAPLLARARKVAGQVRLSARSDWTFSGVEVKAGEPVLITASGKWAISRASADVADADGLPRMTRRGATLRPGALIGRVGEGGAPFHIGAFHVLLPKDAGKLYLGIHDADRADNGGTVEVTLRSFQQP